MLGQNAKSERRFQHRVSVGRKHRYPRSQRLRRSALGIEDQTPTLRIRDVVESHLEAETQTERAEQRGSFLLRNVSVDESRGPPMKKRSARKSAFPRELRFFLLRHVANVEDGDQRRTVHSPNHAARVLHDARPIRIEAADANLFFTNGLTAQKSKQRHLLGREEATCRGPQLEEIPERRALTLLTGEIVHLERGAVPADERSVEARENQTLAQAVEDTLRCVLRTSREALRTTKSLRLRVRGPLEIPPNSSVRGPSAIAPLA